MLCKKLSPFSKVLKRRGRVWLWLPDALEPVCRSFLSRDIQGVSFLSEEEKWSLEVYFKERGKRKIASFQEKAQAQEAFHALSCVLLKRKRPLLTFIGIVLASGITSLFLALEPLSSLPKEELSSPPLPEKGYGIPQDAAEFLKGRSG